jgi:hypothetical protein
LRDGLRAPGAEQEELTGTGGFDNFEGGLLIGGEKQGRAGAELKGLHGDGDGEGEALDGIVLEEQAGGRIASGMPRRMPSPNS